MRHALIVVTILSQGTIAAFHLPWKSKVRAGNNVTPELTCSSRKTKMDTKTFVVLGFALARFAIHVSNTS